MLLHRPRRSRRMQLLHLRESTSLRAKEWLKVVAQVTTLLVVRLETRAEAVMVEVNTMVEGIASEVRDLVQVVPGTVMNVVDY